MALALLWLALFFFVADKMLFFLIREGSFHWYRNIAPKRAADLTAPADQPYSGLVFGSSRALSALVPEYLDDLLGRKFYSAAFPGAYPRYNYLFFQRHRGSLKKVTTALYGVDYFMFKVKSNQRLLDAVTPDQPHRGKMTYPRFGNTPLPNLVRFSFLLWAKPEVDAWRADVVDWLNDLFHQPGLNRPIVPLPADALGGLKTVKPRNWRKFGYLGFPGQEGRYLDLLLKELTAQGITVFLIALPEYVGTYETNVEQRSFKMDMQKICSQMNNVFFLDYADPDRFDLNIPHYFSDGGWGNTSSHLSRPGTRRFCTLLANDVRRLTPPLELAR